MGIAEQLFERHRHGETWAEIGVSLSPSLSRDRVRGLVRSWQAGRRPNARTRTLDTVTASLGAVSPQFPPIAHTADVLRGLWATYLGTTLKLPNKGIVRLVGRRPV